MSNVFALYGTDTDLYKPTCEDFPWISALFPNALFPNGARAGVCRGEWVRDTRWVLHQVRMARASGCSLPLSALPSKHASWERETGLGEGSTPVYRLCSIHKLLCLYKCSFITSNLTGTPVIKLQAENWSLCACDFVCACVRVC